MDDIGIKHEFFTKCDPTSCCHACLSTGRSLSTAAKYIDFCYNILDIHNMPSPNELYFCWECIAILKKLWMFKTKFTEAQTTLQFYYTNKQDPFPPSLSNLTTHTANNQICIQHEVKETKQIKEEIEVTLCEIDVDVYEDNHSDTDIKDEPEPIEAPESTKSPVPESTKSPTKPSNADAEVLDKSKLRSAKLTKNRNAKYRFINSKLMKHRRLLVRKIPVNLRGVWSCLEGERKSASFVKAEYKCVGCVAVYSSKDGLVKHEKKYHDEGIGPYQCTICNIRCPSHPKIETHRKKHGYRRECKVCRFQCFSESVMNKHLERHNRMVQCLACQLCFMNARLFYNHYKALHALFVCDVCGKKCTSRSIIEKHLGYHFGFECPHCKKRLKNRVTYKLHVETQHSSSVSDGSYCVPCDRRFTCDRMYKRHLQCSSAHAAERDNSKKVARQFPCPECSNVYSRRSYMNNHYTHVHAKQSKYYCEDCDRHFLNRTRYLDHRRFQHEGVQKDKNKLCNICGRGFAANRTLIHHIRTHSGERPYSCEYCDAKFTQKHAMLSHVKFIHFKTKRKANWNE